MPVGVENQPKADANSVKIGWQDAVQPVGSHGLWGADRQKSNSPTVSEGFLDNARKDSFTSRALKKGLHHTANMLRLVKVCCT